MNMSCLVAGMSQGIKNWIVVFFPQAKVFEVSLDILESASMIARSTLKLVPRCGSGSLECHQCGNPPVTYQ